MIFYKASSERAIMICIDVIHSILRTYTKFYVKFVGHEIIITESILFEFSQ